jgi:Peptidase family M20/M25/M40/Peptidase dimerisation domain
MKCWVQAGHAGRTEAIGALPGRLLQSIFQLLARASAEQSIKECCCHEPGHPLLVSGALCAATILQAHAEIDVARLKTAIETSVEADYPKLDALYKDIHAHPEIAFQEVKTAARLAAEMRSLGFEVTEKVGKTGLVAIYKNGDGPTIMVRTELDALPMEETTGIAYASHDKTTWNGQETFVAHSCGHDIHMASWVGTAKTLVGLKDQWNGTLMFIAQPAEETVSGAKAMLADGLFTRFEKPDFAFALHDGPFGYGTVSYRVGIGSSNSDSLEITFHGRGGHGAAPQLTIDPVMIGARFIVDVQSVISREKNLTEFGVVSIGAIQGGTAENVIPTTCCCAEPSAPSSRRCAPKCWRGSSGRRRPPPPCRMRPRPISKSPRVPRPW